MQGGFYKVEEKTAYIQNRLKENERCKKSGEIAAYLNLLPGGDQISPDRLPLHYGVNLVGGALGNNIVLRGRGVSTFHAIIEIEEGNNMAFVEDLHSTNGTTLDACIRLQPQRLYQILDQQQLQFGPSTCFIEIPGSKVVPSQAPEGTPKINNTIVINHDNDDSSKNHADNLDNNIVSNSNNTKKMDIADETNEMNASVDDDDNDHTKELDLSSSHMDMSSFVEDLEESQSLFPIDPEQSATISTGNNSEQEEEALDRFKQNQSKDKDSQSSVLPLKRLKDISAGDPPQKIQKTIDTSVTNIIPDCRVDSHEPLVAPLKKKPLSRSKIKDLIPIDNALAAAEKIKEPKSTTANPPKTYKKRDRKQSKNSNNEVEAPLIDETATAIANNGENQNTDISKRKSQEEPIVQDNVEKVVEVEKKEIAKKARGRPKSSTKFLGQENVKLKSTKLPDDENLKPKPTKLLDHDKPVAKSTKSLDENENSKPLAKSLKSHDDENVKPAAYKKNAKKAAVDAKDSVGVTTGRNRGRKINPIRILISISDKGLVTDLKKLVRKLGGEVVESWNNCTHMIADKIKRTVKFLCCLSSGRPIVSPDWLLASEREGKFTDSIDFIVLDSEGEKKFGCNMKKSYSLAKEGPGSLFTNTTFFVTLEAKPPPEEMREIVLSAGGYLTFEEPLEYHKNIKIIGHKDDWKMCSAFQDMGYTIYTADLVLNGILRQQVQYKENELKDF